MTLGNTGFRALLEGSGRPVRERCGRGWRHPSGDPRTRQKRLRVRQERCSRATRSAPAHSVHFRCQGVSQSEPKRDALRHERETLRVDFRRPSEPIGCRSSLAGRSGRLGGISPPTPPRARDRGRRRARAPGRAAAAGSAATAGPPPWPGARPRRAPRDCRRRGGRAGAQPARRRCPRAAAWRRRSRGPRPAQPALQGRSGRGEAQERHRLRAGGSGSDDPLQRHPVAGDVTARPLGHGAALRSGGEPRGRHPPHLPEQPQVAPQARGERLVVAHHLRAAAALPVPGLHRRPHLPAHVADGEAPREPAG